jgi:hypothetical protein
MPRDMLYDNGLFSAPSEVPQPIGLLCGNDSRYRTFNHLPRNVLMAMQNK